MESFCNPNSKVTALVDLHGYDVFPALAAMEADWDSIVGLTFFKTPLICFLNTLGRILVLWVGHFLLGNCTMDSLGNSSWTSNNLRNYGVWQFWHRVSQPPGQQNLWAVQKWHHVASWLPWFPANHWGLTWRINAKNKHHLQSVCSAAIKSCGVGVNGIQVGQYRKLERWSSWSDLSTQPEIQWWWNVLAGREDTWHVLKYVFVLIFFWILQDLKASKSIVHTLNSQASWEAHCRCTSTCCSSSDQYCCNGHCIERTCLIFGKPVSWHGLVERNSSTRCIPTTIIMILLLFVNLFVLFDW